MQWGNSMSFVLIVRKIKHPADSAMEPAGCIGKKSA